MPNRPLTLSDVTTEATQPLPEASTNLPDGQPEQVPPPGFVSFCMRFEDQCSSPSNEVSMISLNADTWSKLHAVNDSVNTKIWPVEDTVHYNRPEYWTIPTDGEGDCEDYALTKRKLLAMDGLPMRALRIAEVITPRNNRHAVLTVTTDKGDYVLDNETSEILPWTKAGYVWLTRQDLKNDWGWVALNGDPRQIASNTAENSTETK